MAKWFKNLKTGHAWEIADEELIERLSASSDFEEVSAPAKETVKAAESEPIPEPIPETSPVESNDTPKTRKKK